MELTPAEQEIIRALRRMRWGTVRIEIRHGRPVSLIEERRTDLNKVDNAERTCYTESVS